jgi:hypothetical protein
MDSNLIAAVTPNLIGLEAIATMQSDMQWINQYGMALFNFSGSDTDPTYVMLLKNTVEALTALTVAVKACQEQLPKS